jgi:nitrite reductase/ring-hydroxylating ferredoxin subunit
VSLYYGFVEEDGIRCAYHGWKYDACGKCLEQPFENPEAGFKDKTSQPAYPWRNWRGSCTPTWDRRRKNLCCPDGTCSRAEME